MREKPLLDLVLNHRRILLAANTTARTATSSNAPALWVMVSAVVHQMIPEYQLGPAVLSPSAYLSVSQTGCTGHHPNLPDASFHLGHTESGITTVLTGKKGFF